MQKVALVTGGNRGIGLGITRRLLADGFSVSILATREEPVEVLASLRELGEVRYIRGNVAEPQDHMRYVQDAVSTWGRLDVLVNNAGVGLRSVTTSSKRARRASTGCWASTCADRTS